MSPEEITSHEPTAVKRDPNDQKIAEGHGSKSADGIRIENRPDRAGNPVPAQPGRYRRV